MEHLVINTQSQKHRTEFLDEVRKRGFSVTGGAHKFKKLFVNNQPNHLSVGGLDPRNEGALPEFGYPKQKEQIYQLLLNEVN